MGSSVSLKTFLHPRYWYAWPVLALLVLSAWLPLRVLWLLGNGLGWLFALMPSPGCRIAARNIELCFPELGPEERRKLVRRHFRYCGLAVLSLGITYFAPLWRLKRVVRLEGQDNFDAARSSGKNIVLLAPHFITLDIGGMRAGHDKNMVCMYRQARDPLLEYLFQRRTRTGAVLVDRLANLKSLIRYIREGRPFYYLPDQDMGERASVFVPFFGIPAATVTALSRIAESTNAAVVPCVSRILPYGKGFEVRFHPALRNFPTKDPVADAARMNLEIEQWVRQMPEQYMWSYRRFKTRPNQQPSLYKK
jgi:KDO2-lipid IV(A) lauroyltransferase